MQCSLRDEAGIVAGCRLQPLAEVAGLQCGGSSIRTHDWMADEDVGRADKQGNDIIDWWGGGVGRDSEHVMV